MKRIIISLFFCSLLFACDKDDNHFQGETDLEKFQREHCYGFKVTDTTNLVVMSEPYYADYKKAYLAGTRDGKLWIAKFNTEGSLLEQEYVDTEVLDLKRSVYYGYGQETSLEADIIKIDYLLISDDNNWLASLEFASSLYGIFYEPHILVFGRTYILQKYEYLSNGLAYPEYLHWYNNSYLVQANLHNLEKPENNYYTCFSSDGKILGEGTLVSYDYTFPLGYTVYMGIRCYDFSRFYVSLAELGMGYSDIQTLEIPREIGKDSIWFCYLEEATEEEITLRIQVIEYAGYTYYFDICINKNMEDYTITPPCEYE